MARAGARTRGAGRSRATLWAFLGAQVVAHPFVALVTVVFLAAAGALLVILFKPNIMEFAGRAVAALGWGLLLLALWALALAVLLKRRRPQLLITRLNLWLGAAALTGAIWGSLAFFHASHGLLADASYGGHLGRAIIGRPDFLGALIVAGLTLASAYLLAPRPSVLATIWLVGRTAALYRRLPLHAGLYRGALALGRFSSGLVRPRRRPAAEEAAPGGKEDGPANEPGLGPAEIPPFSATSSTVEAAPPSLPGAVPPSVPGATPAAARPASPLARALTALKGEAKVESRPAHQEQARQRWVLPPLKLLDSVPEAKVSEADNQKRAQAIEDALSSYGIDAKVVQINPGPAVTQFGVEPGWARKYREIKERGPDGRVKLDSHGRPIVKLEEVSATRVKVDQILALDRDLALALAAPSIRIEAPVPGKSVMGIEVPNALPDIVSLRAVLEGASFQRIHSKSRLAVALGKGAGGEPVAADLQKMPHLLIAGATGSGKSVCINAMIDSVLMFNTPEEVKLLLIDPKRVELTPYNSIPHLLAPVLVDMSQVANALKWLNHEMDQRYRKLAAAGVRNIDAYNERHAAGERMPYLIVVIDELADLMMTSPIEVERSICRLAQLARATGIHLIVATQRPSVDVVTGLIKANFPTRISFAVASQVDSRTILDTPGAESLLGRGDMLYLPQDAPKPTRLQGCFISDAEIERLVDFWAHKQHPAAAAEVSAAPTERLDFTVAAPPVPALGGHDSPSSQDSDDELLEQATALAHEHKRLSTSLLQRRLKIGYPRAARLVDLLEEAGVVGPGEPGKSREVLGGRIATAAEGPARASGTVPPPPG